MPTPAMFYPNAINFASGNDITQITELPLDAGFVDLMIRAGGNPYPGFTGSHSARPSYRFSSTQIKDVLDRCTVEGVAIGGSASNLDIEYQKQQNLATRYGNSDTEHTRSRMTHWLLSWQSISASEDQAAEISFQINPISDDGVNAPVVSTSGVAIASTAAVQHVYGLGPIKLNTSSPSFNDFICVDSWSIESGVRLDLKPCSGGGFLVYAAVGDVTPVLTLQTTDINKVLQYMPAGAAITSVNAFLRRKTAGGLNVSDATTSHIKISGTAGTVKPVSQRELRIPLHNLSFDTASAIS